jgi:hypothetical protein
MAQTPPFDWEKRLFLSAAIGYNSQPAVTPMSHKKNGKMAANLCQYCDYTASKHLARKKPMVNLRIGPILGHFFYHLI